MSVTPLPEEVVDHLAEHYFRESHPRRDWNRITGLERSGWRKHAELFLQPLIDAGLMVIHPTPSYRHEVAVDIMRDAVVVSGDRVVLEHPSEQYMTRDEAISYMSDIAGAVKHMDNIKPSNDDGITYTRSIVA